MLVSKSVYFLLALLVVASCTITQQHAEQFVKDQGLVPHNAKLSKFEPIQDGAILVYHNGFVTTKLGLTDRNGGIELNFKQDIASLSIQTEGMIPSVQHFSNNGISIKQVGLDMPSPFPLNGVEIDLSQKPMQHGRNKMRHSFPKEFHKFKGFHKAGGNKPCKLNENQIKELLKNNLEIFKNAEITEIRKVGFQRGTGLLLEIDLTNDNKQYTIHAGFIPRFKKLNVIKIEEKKTEEKKNHLEVGKQLVGKVMNDVKGSLHTVSDMGLKFENAIQSFVEKLLVRRNLKLGQNEEYEQIEQHPLVGSEGEPEFVEDHPLVGSEGEPEMTQPLILGSEGEQELHNHNKPLLLGSEGEPERQHRDHPLVGSEGEQEMTQKPLLGEEGENPHAAEFVPQEDHHDEEMSEEVSKLVNEVLNTLKLKTQ